MEVRPDGDELATRIAEVGDLLARGEYLSACDAATASSDLLTSGASAEGALRLRYLRALALARSGATTGAEAAIEDLTADLADRTVSDALAEDVTALAARLVKDRALTAGTERRPAMLAEAAARYEEVYDRLGRPFACINAAALWSLAGDARRAEGLARRAMELTEGSLDGPPADRYWAAATRAEAALLLGRTADARSALEAAAVAAPGDYAARAATRRQLRLLCEARGLDPDEWLAAIANPSVVHYCGHLADPSQHGARFSRDAEPMIRTELRRWVRGRQIGFAHGSLAAGADIVAAEVLLDRGAELHVVLPFDPDEFAEVSVKSSGCGWEERFHRCLDRARTVTVASDSAHLEDDVLFGFASRLAMGSAVNRAAALEVAPHQLAVWDGRPGTGRAGTGHDVAVWRARGLSTHVIRLAPDGRADPAASPRARRSVRAVLFGDVSGFSRLRDEHIEPFLATVMTAVARVLDAFGGSILQRNTWGDGLFVVTADVVSGAEVALAIQGALRRIDLAAAGLPGDLSMRLAAHAGPLLAVHDPVLDQPALMGRELIRAARIEPRTPPGEVYATSAFAALLALEAHAPVNPEYVGHLTTAKGFETIPMYVLRPR